MDEIPFCVRDVLNRPLFQRAIVLAGAQGVYREVRWVHILEIIHAAPYVSKHDLILTTGLWLKRSAKSGIEYMRQIIEHQTAGLCIEFGTTVDEIPDQIIDLCDSYDFPLILFRQPVRFEEITQDIHAHIINQHFGLLKKIEQFSQQQQQLILQSTDIPAILRLLQSYSEHQILYLSRLEANTYFPPLPEETREEINTFCDQQMKHFDQIQETELWKMDEHRYVLIQPVVCFGQVFSYVGMLLHQAHPTEYMKLLVDYTSKAVATVLLRTQFLEEKILSNQNELIQDILNRSIDSEEQAQMRMGLPSPNGEKYIFVGGIIEFEHNVIEAGPERMESRNQDILVLIRSLLKRDRMHHVLMMKNNQIYLLCAKARIGKDSESSLYQKIQGLIDGLNKYINQAWPHFHFHIGFGKSRTMLLDAWISFKEAFQVIELSQTVPAMKQNHYYASIGVYQLLHAVPYPILSDFVQDQLGELIAYENKHHLHLIDTLAMYFKCMGSKGETAKRLFIHRQTLYNRLEKISDILGEDYFQPQRRHCLEMAMLGYPLIESYSADQ